MYQTSNIQNMKKLFISTVFLLVIFTTGVQGFFADSSEFKTARLALVDRYIQGQGISDARVLAAMRKVPRHAFVPKNLQDAAYADRPLPIGEGQTISQPYVVALMTEILDIKADHRVLEIGTGSGYQAAILAEIAKEVYSIEIKHKLYNKSNNILNTIGYKNLKTRQGDGYFGWKEAAPFDAIMITAAVDHIPPPLIEQLRDGGRLTLPLGNPFSYQNLVLVTKKGDDVTVKQITGVLFVPMTGHALNR